MSWEDHHLRSDIVRTVLDRAALDPNDPALFSGIPQLERLFGGPEGLLLTLRHRWNNHLAAKLDQAFTQGQSEVEAYLELSAEQPALRALLDRQYRHRDSVAAAPVR
ncbi:hypothetical protein [Nocardia sp. NPDC005366]|uniref:hypothetical protein n=1 Tax=Nocardia sp. NPDC005366 TaxID=3156878 RepID=UPI00339DC004